MREKPGNGSALQQARDDLGYAIKQLHHLLHAAFGQRMRAQGLDLTFPHAVALHLLSEAPGLSGAQLARWAMVTPQTMNQILTRLERDGLIQRRSDPAHGRILKTFVTAKGRREFDRGCETGDALLAEAQRGLSAAERRQLLALLQRCIANLSWVPHGGPTEADDLLGAPPRPRRRKAR